MGSFREQKLQKERTRRKREKKGGQHQRNNTRWFSRDETPQMKMLTDYNMNRKKPTPRHTLRN